jgi:hypothetical protein
MGYGVLIIDDLSASTVHTFLNHYGFFPLAFTYMYADVVCEKMDKDSANTLRMPLGSGNL